MKCYYEVLELGRDADSAEIKSAYRKFALKWHPDKNLDDPESAKEQFQLVQQAYEVLSDRQERAWYDKHRDQILYGSDSEFKENRFDVFPFFITSCFKGFGDDTNGFYAVYRKVFDQIIEEDMEFIEDKDDFKEIPRFGDSTSDYDEIVGPFYNYWSSYCTRKTYVWLDPYNINETIDRRSLKVMEKENKKVRQQAKKERNEEVRNLVAFVRKRDKRVQLHTKVVEARILENRQKQEEISKQKRLERKQQLNNSVQAEWAKFDNVKSQLEEIEKHLNDEFGHEFTESDEEEELENNLYCVACNKVFKTPKAFANHESSKKHKENVEKLRDLMQEEEELMENGVEETGSDLEDDDVSENELSDSSIKKPSKKSRKKANGVAEHNLGEEEQFEPEMECLNSDTDDLDVKGKGKKTKKKGKKAKNVLKVDNGDNDKVEVESDNDFDFSTTKKQKKKAAKKVIKETKSTVKEESVSHSINGDNNVVIANGRSKNKKSAVSEQESESNQTCRVCNSQFQSSNKLFTHLKATGHAVYKDVKKNKKRS